MPIYEYRCPACRKRSSVFVRNIAAAPETATCEHCGAPGATRVFSRVAVHRGEEGALDFAERGLGDVDESDPRSVAKWVRRMSTEMGEPLDADMQSELERLESGEMPDDDDFAGAADAFGDVD